MNFTPQICEHIYLFQYTIACAHKDKGKVVTMLN